MKPLTKLKDALHKLWWLLLLILALLASLGIWWYFDYKIEQLKQTQTTFQTLKNNVL
jgi:Tfp pilus assembly protein PilO